MDVDLQLTALSLGPFTEIVHLMHELKNKKGVNQYLSSWTACAANLTRAAKSLPSKSSIGTCRSSIPAACYNSCITPMLTPIATYNTSKRDLQYS
jgi:hypothetical protein